jgi:O-6-methylguanine DNA methyltransferase
MISIWIEHVKSIWYGVAHHGDRLVATATGSERERTERAVRQSLRRDAECHVVPKGTAYARRMVELLARLEAGEETSPAFELCPDCVPEPLASVALVASIIPRGYVATYGGIAAAAGTEARVVGHIMATNPLYPIIPCHRVVGVDLALVGYTGSRDAPARRAKLGRLRAEAMGFTTSRQIFTPLKTLSLTVIPVERVLAQAVADGLDDGGQLSLW